MLHSTRNEPQKKNMFSLKLGPVFTETMPTKLTPGPQLSRADRMPGTLDSSHTIGTVLWSRSHSHS